MAKRKLKKKAKITILIVVLIILISVLVVVGLITYDYYQKDSQKLTSITNKKSYYRLSDFGFINITSPKDYNNNGNDDYKDILEGAKQYAEFNPKYKSDYYDTGYPPVEKEGISSDLIWYSLKQAGYDLKTLVSKDINKNKKKYYASLLDENIDFRRVANLDVFFSRYAKDMTTDIEKVGEFMPGDILIFDYDEYAAIVSDKYNKNGVPYIISNRSDKQKQKEENILEKTDMTITGHYRFEYSKKLEKLINS